MRDLILFSWFISKMSQEIRIFHNIRLHLGTHYSVKDFGGFCLAKFGYIFFVGLWFYSLFIFYSIFLQWDSLQFRWKYNLLIESQSVYIERTCCSLLTNMWYYLANCISIIHYEVEILFYDFDKLLSHNHINSCILFIE